ncbi:hypothetical protein [Mucilaginibacter sp. UYCu711]|uniref:hypothetical protein n=1 Tax=Mucilaginibacter sp. UYCu711 TaxID=3156339 RepID=UPI003D1913F8
MKNLVAFAFFTLIASVALGQHHTPDCKCPVNQYAGTSPAAIFHLANGRSIALCGSEVTDIIKGKTLYSEFVLSVCGSNKLIKFWGATDICNIRTLKDTLFVETLVNLPVGKAMSYRETIWTTERIYFIKGKLKRDSAVNFAIPKYNPSQISAVLNLYNKTKDQNSVKTGELIDKLFISTISGSRQARTLLINFHKKFTLLDGYVAEQYDDVIRMLNLWDKKS